MKKFKLLNWILLPLIVFHFASCDNEPLVGEFIQQGDPNLAEEGEFRAQIDGVEFLATLAEAVLTTENLLVVSGTNETTGEKITLTAAMAGVGTFNLIAGVGTENVAKYFDETATTNPYTSDGPIGGSGQMIISDLNTEDLTITGTFSFVGKRIQLDTNGDPVLDGNGDPIIEEVSVTPGVFNTIPYILDDSGSGGGTGGDPDPMDDFHALVDGEEFLEDTITTTITTVGGVDMVNIVARTITNAKIRIDFPLFSGTGTFPMVPLSDGTKVTALYNSNTGGENLTSNPGSITITEIDTEAGVIVATFSFSGSDPLGQDPTVVAVTDGSFTVNFDGIAGSGPNPFTAEVDGVLYESDVLNINLTIISGTEIVTIATSAADNSTLSLAFPRNIEVGTYMMSSDFITGNEKVGVYNPVSGGTPTFSSDPGTLTINSYDMVTGDVEGTFSFTGVDSSGSDPTVYDITNGAFMVTLVP